LNTSTSREAPFPAAVVFFLAHVRAALRVSVIVRATDKCSTPAAKTPVALPRLSICGAAADLPPAGASAGAALPYSFPERPGTLDFLGPSINYSSCRDVVQLYSVRHSGDMARIRDTAPVICRGFLLWGASCQEASKASAGGPMCALLTAARAAPISHAMFGTMQGSRG
jgi:hypothetical protein